MFKKLALFAGGASAAAEVYGGKDEVTPICVTQDVAAYTATGSVYCHNATIKLVGGGTPADDVAAETDGYSATMTVKFLNAAALTKDVFIGVCIVAIADTADSAPAHLKVPRGMCLGINTGCALDNATSADDRVTVVGQDSLRGGTFGHVGFLDIVTNNAVKSDAAAVAQTKASDAAGCMAQTTAAQAPTGLISMAAITKYGAITSPASTWYDNDATVANWAMTGSNELVGTLVLSANHSTATTATWFMPTETDEYKDVPRLSPADSEGWQSYAPDTVTADSYGKMIAQVTVTQGTIITNCATVVAAGVALVGATALSF